MRRIVAVFVLFLFASLLQAQDQKLPSASLSKEKQAAYSDLAVKLATEYFQIDTTNPPGNEAKAAAFFKKVFDAEGIENQVFHVAPGRDNILARLHGSGKKRPIILLSHEDVVISDPSKWKHPPFSAAVDNGEMYARGAVDMKDEGLSHLMTMIMLKREQVPLDRDVIMLADADEEVGSIGTQWMIDNQRPLIGDAEYVINEGGYNLREPDGKVRYIGVELGERSAFWLILTATGRPGHGSRPQPDSAPNRLVRALNRVIAYETPMRVTPIVDEFFKSMAKFETGEKRKQFENVAEAIKDPRFRKQIEATEGYNFMFRDTISLTRMEGSGQTNVIPGVATAHLDVRLLPGEDPQKFLATLQQVIDDRSITITPETKKFKVPNASSMDTDLYRAIRKAGEHHLPGAVLTPRMESGQTDSQIFRQIDVVAYGFNAYAYGEEISRTEHSDNERIPVSELRRAPFFMYDVVSEVAAAK